MSEPSASVLVAWLGFLLGVLNTTLMAIGHRLSHHKSLLVGFRCCTFPDDSGNARAQFRVAVVNSCERPITVAHVWLARRAKGETGFVDLWMVDSDGQARQPQLLQPGTYLTALLPPGAEKDGVNPLDMKAFALDAEGRIHGSRSKLREENKQGLPFGKLLVARQPDGVRRGQGAPIPANLVDLLGFAGRRL